MLVRIVAVWLITALFWAVLLLNPGVGYELDVAPFALVSILELWRYMLRWYAGSGSGRGTDSETDIRNESPVGNAKHQTQRTRRALMMALILPPLLLSGVTAALALGFSLTSAAIFFRNIAFVEFKESHHGLMRLFIFLLVIFPLGLAGPLYDKLKRIT